MQNEYIIIYDGELYHWGIKGMKLGIRRYQNPDGSFTPVGRKRLEKADSKWAKKKTNKITAQAKKKASQRELDEYGDALLQLPNAFRTNGKLSAQVINAYNKKMAELMSQKTSDIIAPSGRVVSFVAKRGEIGVFMALSNYEYDLTQYRQGVYGDGRIAYRKTHANKINI